MKLNIHDFQWTREPGAFTVSDDKVEIVTKPHTDLWQGGGKIRFGIYACSPEDSSFKAVFTNMELTECKWLAHDGQQPDKE